MLNSAAPSSLELAVYRELDGTTHGDGVSRNAKKRNWKGEARQPLKDLQSMYPIEFGKHIDILLR